MRTRNQVCGFGTWFQLRHICPAMMFPKNCRASYDMLGLPFFVIRENLAEHWSGNEVQTCNLRGSIGKDIECGAMQAILSLRPNSYLGILVPHSGPVPGLRSRPNLDLGTSVPYSTYSLQLHTIYIVM